MPSGLICAVWALASFVHAAPVWAAELRFEAPADCGVTRADLEAQIERLVGQPLSAMAEDVFAVRVRRAGQAWQLVLSANTGRPGAARARQIRGATCTEVTDAAAVAIALAVAGHEPADDAAQSWEPAASEHDRSAAEPAGSAQPSVELKPATADAARGEPSDSSATAATLRLGFGIAGLVDTAALPEVGVGAAIHLLVELSAFRAELLAALYVPQEAELSDGRGGKFELAMGGVRACGRGALAALGVMGCAGFEAGQLSARGLHVRTEHPRSTAWFALSADAGLVWTVVPKLGLLLQAGVARPLSRPTFVLDGTQAVHRTAALTVRALFGAELYF